MELSTKPILPGSFVVVKDTNSIYRGYKGLVDGIDTDPSYLDITLTPNVKKRFPFDTRRQGLLIFLRVQLILETHRLHLE